MFLARKQRSERHDRQIAACDIAAGVTVTWPLEVNSASWIENTWLVSRRLTLSKIDHIELQHTTTREKKVLAVDAFLRIYRGRILRQLPGP
jgi:hypothetical protein